MRALCTIILFILAQIGLAQNYADSARILGESFGTDSLSPFHQSLVDTNTARYFQPQALDTHLLVGMTKIAAYAHESELGEKYSDLMGRFCEARLQSSISEKDKKLFHRYNAIYLHFEGIRLKDEDRFQEGLEKIYKALEISTSIADTAYMVHIIRTLGLTYFNVSDYEEAEKWYRKGFLLEEKRGNELKVARFKASIGDCQLEKGKYEEALQNYEVLLAATRKYEDEREESLALNSMGFIYRKMEKYALAIQHFEQALVIFQKIGFTSGISGLYRQIGLTAIDMKDWQKAKKYGLLMLEISEKNPSHQFRKNAAQIMKEVYRAEGNYKKGMEMQDLYHEMKDSVLGQSTTKALLDQKYKFEYQQKAVVDSLKHVAALDLQIAENKRRKTATYFLGILIAVLGGFGLILWNRFRLTRRQKAMIEEEKIKVDAANEKLKELDNMKSRFFTNISHELRTPLSLILGPTSHLLKRFSGQLDSDGVEILKLIRRNGNSLLNLVEELLEVSKLDAGKARLHEESVAFHPFCRQLFSAFESMAAFKEITYSFSYDLPEDIHVILDKNHFTKIVNNLLSNAFKFTFQGGAVSLNVRESERLNEQSDDQAFRRSDLLLSVSDTGRGIPEEDVPQVFDRYFQTTKADIATEGGTGVGLSLSWELVRMMGGELTVESELGKGSVFTLRLPLNEGEKPQTEIEAITPQEEEPMAVPVSAVPAPNGSSRAKVLVVEDNPDMQRLIESLLKDTYECVLARDGQEAWEWLEKDDSRVKGISLILSDIMMPRLDGYGLLERIKGHKIWSSLPVVMLTARAAEADKLSALRMGVDDYLLKPFSPEELTVRLANLITNYKARTPLVAAGSPISPIDFGEVTSADTEWLKKMEEVTLAALEKGLTLSASYLSDQMALSDRQMLRRVKALTGLSVTQYIQEVKLQKARHFLEHKTYRTIGEVAYKTGFNSQSYFSRLYEKRFGKKPGEY